MKEYVKCSFCANQGLHSKAYKLQGQDAKTVYPNTTRYGCEHGHKFALPNSKEAPCSKS